MKVIKWLDEYLEEVLMTLLLFGIVLIMAAQVITRYVFNNSLSWTDELARYFLTWSCFLSVSYCVKKRISIKIDQFQNMLKPSQLPWIKMIRHTIVFIFCILMLPYSWTYIQQAVASGATSPALLIPMYYIQAAPFAGFLLLAVRVAQAWIREWKASRRIMMQMLKEEILGEIRKEQENKEGSEA